MSEQDSKPPAKPTQSSGTSSQAASSEKNGKKGGDAPAKNAPQGQPAPPKSAPTRGSAKATTGNDAQDRTVRRRRGALWLALLALLLALAAIAGGVYLWQRQQALLQQMQRQQAQQSDQLGSVRDALDSRAAALQRRDEDIAKAQQDLRDAVESVRQLAGRSRRDWILSEVEYLLRIGNRRLQLQRDPATAIAALQIADERLHELADPGLTDVRERIARELDQLRATPRPDVEGIAVQLSSLQEQVPQLHVKSARAPARGELPGAAAQHQAPPEAWREGLQRAWQAVRRLVVIRRRDEPIKPLLGPEQEFAVRDGLRLQLEAARVALLQGNQALYSSSIQGAGDWLKRYFVADNAAYGAMQQSLQKLGERNIRPQLPDISASLRRLREIMNQRDLNTDSVHQEAAPGSESGAQQSTPAAGQSDRPEIRWRLASRVPGHRQ